MTIESVQYSLQDQVATIRIDDARIRVLGGLRSPRNEARRYECAAHAGRGLRLDSPCYDLTMPRVAAAMLHHRLNPAAFQRAVTLSEFFDVDLR